MADLRSGKHTALELADLYHCHHQTIYNWIYKYSPADSPKINVAEMSESTDQKVKDLHDKIAQFEHLIQGGRYHQTRRLGSLSLRAGRALDD